MGLDYKILYRKGIENKVAYILSRRPEDGKEQMMAIQFTIQPT